MESVLYDAKESLVAEAVGGGLLPRGAGRDLVPPSLDVLVTIEGILESLDLEEVGGVGEEGQVSEGEVVASEELGLGQASLKNVEQAVELLSHGFALGLVGSLTIESGAEEELNHNIDDGSRVGLVGGEPGLDNTTLLQIRRIELLSVVLGSNIASNSTRLEERVITILEDGNLTEGLMFGDKVGGLVLTLREIDGLDLILGTDLLEGSDDSTRASGAVVTQELVGGRHFLFDGIGRFERRMN